MLYFNHMYMYAYLKFRLDIYEFSAKVELSSICLYNIKSVKDSRNQFEDLRYAPESVIYNTYIFVKRNQNDLRLTLSLTRRLSYNMYDIFRSLNWIFFNLMCVYC